MDDFRFLVSNLSLSAATFSSSVFIQQSPRLLVALTWNSLSWNRAHMDDFFGRTPKLQSVGTLFR
jgi:hypothetical protein